MPDWYTQATGGYIRTGTEALTNATRIYEVLYSLGWTLEAVCGVLGNIEAESTYNPWRWQSDVVLPMGDPRIEYQNGHAYGLCQWDPAAKYISGGSIFNGYKPNYSDRPGGEYDGKAQLLYLNDYADYYPTASYPLSYAQYKAASISDYTISYLAHAWFANFERGTWSDSRVSAAEYWWAIFNGQPPPDPPPGPPPGRRLPIWLLFKLKEANS